MWKKIVFLFCGILGALVLSEAVIRAGGAVFSLSQKHANLERRKDKEAFRIICLGESMTAMGGKGAYPRQLEEMLNQRLAPARFRVFNKGAVWTNSSFIVAHLKSYLEEYTPDLIVVMTGINDDSAKFYENIHGTDSAVFRNVHLYRFFMLAASQISERLRMAFAFYLEGDKGCSDLGWSFLDQNKLFQAETMFKRAIIRNPGNQWAYCGLGTIYRMTGDYRMAEECFLKAIEINPRNALAYTFLGWVLKLSGRPDRSAKMLERALAINPDDYNARSLLGWVYVEQHKLSQAEDVLKKAIALDPGKEDAYFKLAQVYAAGKKFDKACVVLQQGLLSFPRRKSRIYGALAGMYQSKGRSELAAEFFIKAREAGKEERNTITAQNLRAIQKAANERRIPLVCVQYPMRPVEILTEIFTDDRTGVFFVDNEGLFKEAVQKKGFRTYFADLFAGDFGHCTAEGNRLLAENIADTIRKEIFTATPEAR